MKTFSIVSVCLVTLFLLISFMRQLVKKEIRPALAMWQMFSVAVIMSMVTYLHSGDHLFRARHYLYRLVAQSNGLGGAFR